MVKEKLEDFKVGEVFLATNVAGKKRRCAREYSGTVFVYGKGCSVRGWRFSEEDFKNKYEIIPVNPTSEWHKRLKRALKALNKSGLWPNLKERYEKLLNISLEEISDIHKTIKNINKFPEYNERKLETYKQKYPYFFDIDGKFVIDEYDTVIACNLKTMYFGKYDNKCDKEFIRKKIEAKEKLSFYRSVNYDVSFSFNGSDKAYYSEEYKGTGNGHYYAALDENVAVFLEND